MIDFVDPIYILTIAFFVLALQRMSSPKTARSGILYAGVAMLVAVLVTFFVPGISNLLWIVGGAALGGFAGWYAAKKVKMTDMPQMVAIFNGMGGGAAAGIAAVELVASESPASFLALAVAGGLIGSVSFSGSVIAFLKLQGWMTQKPVTFLGQQPLNLAVLALAVASGISILWIPGGIWLAPFFLLALLYGLLMTLPIGGADMPVVISMYNALTGVAVALDGFALVDTSAGAAAYAMIIAGTLVGAAGSLLTIVMARAMNRSLGNVLFGAFGAKEEASTTVQGSMKSIEVDDAALLLAYASTVVIAPGYGMAVAQAQHKVKELMAALEAKGVRVKFGIHPVAGRMPGHMNVLLAEAGVPYDHLFDRDEIDPEFASTDVVVVIGANDVVNPAARRAGSPLEGMPILDVDQAKNVLVLKRGQGKGFAGIENDLFYRDNARMLYGDASESVAKLV
ncbi:MAG TPA: NAD(P)(+) transhydrogenase (Re/Si-specific) subunit beta, partial [Thermoplasmata archaeon]|nr:NAD(P)(+) transhydrogenase (Re/Si-specific) subunit beta [Thermoplasmata archaeon]